MSRRGGFPGGMGGFGGMNINQLMKEAKKMQADMEKSQEELGSREFETTAGGGAVYVKVNGNKVIKEIKLQKDVVDPDDVEMLQDLINRLGILVSTLIPEGPLRGLVVDGVIGGAGTVVVFLPQILILFLWILH